MWTARFCEKDLRNKDGAKLEVELPQLCPGDRWSSAFDVGWVVHELTTYGHREGSRMSETLVDRSVRGTRTHKRADQLVVSCKHPCCDAPTTSSGDAAVSIHRARIQSLTIYELTDSELEALLKGSPGALYLDFAVFLLSTATSFLIVLVSTDIPSSRVFSVFVVVAVVGYDLGFLLLCLWYRSRRSVTSTVQRIKTRLHANRLDQRAHRKRHGK
jgi:hypothetical protein